VGQRDIGRRNTGIQPWPPRCCTNTVT